MIQYRLLVINFHRIFISRNTKAERIIPQHKSVKRFFCWNFSLRYESRHSIGLLNSAVSLKLDFLNIKAIPVVLRWHSLWCGAGPYSWLSILCKVQQDSLCVYVYVPIRYKADIYYLVAIRVVLINDCVNGGCGWNADSTVASQFNT